MIRIAETARISHLADIEDSVRGSLIQIGENCVVDSFVKIKPAGGSGNIIIGPGCHINSGCVFYAGNGIVIGRGCLIAANCTLAPTNHAYARRDIMIAQQGFAGSKGGIVLEDDVWVGANSVLLDGVYVETCAIIAAGSMVRGRLQAYGIYAGNPARLIGER